MNGELAQAMALAAITSQAWIFGGMGSWNDMAFETATDNGRYQQLTRELRRRPHCRRRSAQR